MPHILASRTQNVRSLRRRRPTRSLNMTLKDLTASSSSVFRTSVLRLQFCSFSQRVTELLTLGFSSAIPDTQFRSFSFSGSYPAQLSELPLVVHMDFWQFGFTDNKAVLESCFSFITSHEMLPTDCMCCLRQSSISRTCACDGWALHYMQLQHHCTRSGDIPVESEIYIRLSLPPVIQIGKDTAVSPLACALLIGR